MAVVLRFATRKSALAVAQTSWVMSQYRARNSWFVYERVELVTEGDRVQDRPLYEIGGKGLFVKEIERALVDGEADLAVHSMKDLPAELAAGLEVVAVPVRESPWDLLLTRDGRTLDALERGARVGTTSLRRRLQLADSRPDLQFVQLRGNIDTRLRKLDAGEYDAIVLAEAGVRRLGLAARGVSLEDAVVPAIGQGALAIEGMPRGLRESSPPIDHFARELEDADARVEVEAERAVQRALGADCVTPVGAVARVDRAAGELSMRGFLATPDGARRARATVRGPLSDAARIGEALAAELRARLE